MELRISFVTWEHGKFDSMDSDYLAPILIFHGTYNWDRICYFTTLVSLGQLGFFTFFKG